MLIVAIHASTLLLPALLLAATEQDALAGVEIRRVDRPAGGPEPLDAFAAEVADALQDAASGTYVWAAGEFDLARRVRAACRTEGVARRDTSITHYWRRAQTHDAASASAVLRQQADLVTPWALRVAATLDVADTIGDGAATADDVAAATGADPGGMRALLDYLVHVEVLLQGDDGYRLSPTGDLLRSDHGYGWRDRLARSAAETDLDAALAGLLVAVRDGVAGHPSVVGDDFWTVLERRGDVGASFDRDLGGGDGRLLAVLLERWPHLSGTLVEQGSTAQRGAASLSSSPVGARIDVARAGLRIVGVHPTPTGLCALDTVVE